MLARFLRAAAPRALRRNPLRDEAGGIAVEFALTLPVLMLLVGGIVDGGLLIYTWGNMEHVGRQAARAVAIGAATQQQARDYVAAKLLSSTGGLVPTTTVTTTIGATPLESEVVVQVTVPRTQLIKVLPFRIFALQSLQSTVRVRLET